MSGADFVIIIPLVLLFVGFIYFNFIFPKKSKEGDDASKDKNDIKQTK